MKNLYLNCYSINECAEDSPNMVHVQLTDEMVERIVMLASWIAQAETYKISEFFGADYYDNCIIEENELDHTQLTPEVLANITPERTDLDMIHITHRFGDVYSVSFSTIPKHCGDSEKIMTDYIDIAELLKHNTINQIEI